MQVSFPFHGRAWRKTKSPSFAGILRMRRLSEPRDFLSSVNSFFSSVLFLFIILFLPINSTFLIEPWTWTWPVVGACYLVRSPATLMKVTWAARD